MKDKMKEFFATLWYYITFPFTWLSTRRIRKLLARTAAKDRAALASEKDAEILERLKAEVELQTSKTNSNQ